MKLIGRRKKSVGVLLAAFALILMMALSSCGSKANNNEDSNPKTDITETENSSSKAEAGASNTDETEGREEGTLMEEDSSAKDDAVSEAPEAVATSSISAYQIVTTVANVTSDGMIDATSIFTDRDMSQTADLSQAKNYSVKDGEDIHITEEGVYIIEGSASDVTISVDAADEAKVQLVLDGVSITNDSEPAIYVKNADKVFVTTVEGKENNLEVSGTFVADGETNTDAVIFSKDDLILNGLGELSIVSSENGITSKDDLKITGGTISIDAVADAVEANNSIPVADGNIVIVTNKDGFHAEKDTDDTLGYIYICGGNIEINAADDGIHGTTIVQIDDGNIDISATEVIESTFVQLNGGSVNLYSIDDGINASYKSSAYYPTIEVNGGNITVSMGQGDTDAIDSNGDIYINGGTLDIYAQSPFDCDGAAEYNGGTIIVNGVETNEITTQFGMGGHGGGGPGGGWGGPGGGW